jgi:hypothetical protein
MRPPRYCQYCGQTWAETHPPGLLGTPRCVASPDKHHLFPRGPQPIEYHIRYDAGRDTYHVTRLGIYRDKAVGTRKTIMGVDSLIRADWTGLPTGLAAHDRAGDVQIKTPEAAIRWLGLRPGDEKYRDAPKVER